MQATLISIYTIPCRASDTVLIRQLSVDRHTAEQDRYAGDELAGAAAQRYLFPVWPMSSDSSLKDRRRPRLHPPPPPIAPHDAMVERPALHAPLARAPADHVLVSSKAGKSRFPGRACGPKGGTSRGWPPRRHGVPNMKSCRGRQGVPWTVRRRCGPSKSGRACGRRRRREQCRGRRCRPRQEHHEEPRRGRRFSLAAGMKPPQEPRRSFGRPSAALVRALPDRSGLWVDGTNRTLPMSIAPAGSGTSRAGPPLDTMRTPRANEPRRPRLSVRRLPATDGSGLAVMTVAVGAVFLVAVLRWVEDAARQAGSARSGGHERINSSEEWVEHAAVHVPPKMVRWRSLALHRRCLTVMSTCAYRNISGARGDSSCERVAVEG